MEKVYKKFYEIGNNRYYTLMVSDDLYIGTESIIGVARPAYRFWEKDTLTQGLKLLNFSTTIAMLFRSLVNAKKEKGQRGVHKDDFKYEHIDNAKLKKEIFAAYDEAVELERIDLNKRYAMWLESLKEMPEEKAKSSKELYDSRFQEAIKMIEEKHPLKTDLSLEPYTKNKVIKQFYLEGKEHLVTERLNSFANTVYLYEQDIYSNLTIYKFTVCLDVIKSMETFIYNRDVINALLNKLYEDDNKKNKKEGK